jgi:hypothetical protein
MKNMKAKIFLLVTFVILVTLTANAQSLKLGIEGKYVENESEIYYFGSPEEISGTLKVYFQLTNLTDKAIKVEGSYDAISQFVGEDINNVCAFEKCFLEGQIDTSEMGANYTEGLNEEFYFTIIFNSSNTPAAYRLILNVVGNTSDSASAIIHFINREDIPEDIRTELQSLGMTDEFSQDTFLFASGGITGDVPGMGDVANSELIAPASNKISVYPNPASDNVNFNLGNEKGRLTILSTTGKVVYQTQSVSGITQIDVKKFVSGIYFYSFENTIGKRVGKLLVK